MRRINVRPLLAVAFAAALALAGMSLPRATKAQAQVFTSNERTEVVTGGFVPCANGGQGEDVLVTGTLHEIVHFAVNDNHAAFNHFSNLQGFSGVGLTTGDKYHLVGAGHSTVNFQLDGATDTETLVNVYNFVGQGPDNNFTMRELLHFTMNNNFEVTSVKVTFDFQCQ